MNKKICVIAGANSQIAVAIAERFMQECILILCYHKHDKRIQHLLSNEDVYTMRGDFQHEDQCHDLIRICYEKYSKIDIIINCIGKNTNSDGGISEEVWDDVMAVNLKPVFFLCKYYQKYYTQYQQKNIGCVINIASTAGIRALPLSPHYITAKAGMIALSKYYANVMAPNIRVNSIAPGFVETDKHKSEKYSWICNSIPMKRMASLDEIAETACYLATCEYITSQTLIVDGGMIG